MEEPAWLVELKRNHTQDQESHYQRFLNGRTWAALREAVLVRSHGLCERCTNGAPCEAVHHLDYSRGWGVGAKKSPDGTVDLSQADLTLLLGVCKLCHEYLHGELDRDPATMTWWK